MAKHIVKGYITHTQYSRTCKPTVSFSTFKPSAEYSPDTVVVSEHQIEVEVPDNYDPRAKLVAALEEQKRVIRAEFAKSVKDIDQRIQSLLAIEHTA